MADCSSLAAMHGFYNPAATAFVAWVGAERSVGQVLIRREADSFSMRHEADRDRTGLRELPWNELRALVQTTAKGAFRPLKSAPTLVNGWLVSQLSAADAPSALDLLYPGFVADWHAVQSGTPPVTHYREFTNRQTGMYRITQLLNDAQAGQVIRASCHQDFCLKRRLWTVDGQAADGEGKGVIPCLEPCAVLLEFARKAARIEQGERVPLTLGEDELQTVLKALEIAIYQGTDGPREGDVSAADNPRRLRLVIEKLLPLMPATKKADGH